MLDSVQQWVKGIDPQHKQRLMLGAMLLVGGGVLYIYVSSGEGGEENSSDEESQEHSLSITEEEVEGYNPEQLASRMEDLQERNEELSGQLEELEQEEEEESESEEDSEERKEEQEEREKERERMEAMQERMAELEEQLKEEAQEADRGQEGADEDGGEPPSSEAPSTDGGDPPSSEAPSTEGRQPPSPQDQRSAEEDQVWEREPVMARSSESDSEAEGAGSESPEDSVGETKVYGGKEDEEEEEESEEDLEFAHLTSGSILSGELLSGLDAPTGQAARGDPMPVLVRVHKNAILPNHYRAEVRECFVVGAAYGDLSSERAYIRGNTISCVMDDEDRSVVEQPIALYATGDDGKAGVRGNLVTKQGQVLTKAMMAGFAEGMSEAFDVQQVPSLNLGGGGDIQTQSQQPNADMLQGGAASGVSSALDRLAQFYIDMAEGMYPIVEVDAGREVDLIVTQGATLEPGKNESSGSEVPVPGGN